VTNADQPLWQPSMAQIEAANLTAFMRQAAARWQTEFADYQAFRRWSVAESEKFWQSLWDFGGVIASTRGDRVVADKERMPGARWFPDARLNFAENLLRRRDGATAMVFRGEDRVRRSTTFGELYDRVSQLAQALAAAGIGPGDRVAAFMPNLPETMMAMLASASLGAIWSSCSPDFGPKGVMDRFGQIEPRVLFTADGYFYAGKQHDSLERARAIAGQLDSLETVVVVPYVGENPDPGGLPGGVLLDDFVAPHTPGDIAFQPMGFNDPLYILYSSGTTGMPKCIVHGAGGTLLQHLKEHQLHCDLKPDDRLFYFTTCGWMMWNWLVSGLATGATLMLYDGAPFHPDGNTVFDFAAEERFSHLGTSAKFIDAANKAGLEPARSHDLGGLRAILSTGSPLVAESFDYVYRAIKSDVCLASMSGGTDIVGCFAGGNPIAPVWRGELQSLALAMDVEVFDAAGQPLRGDKGELVCRNSFPSMPVSFWHDDDGAKYRAAYFEVYPGVWRHGDWCEITGHEGMIIYGRSDAVLNPGGVRIGTAEIYRQVEQLDEVLEALIIGQDWQNDVRLVLFVRLVEGLELDGKLETRLRRQIRDNTTPRHVPARIVQVADIPRTISGKIVELAVRDVVHGREVKNRDALANPEALELFSGLPELAE